MFDWTTISSDPNHPEVFEAWKRHYEDRIVRFDLFSPVDRDQRIIQILENLSTEGSLSVLDIGFAEHGVNSTKSPEWFHRILRQQNKFHVHGLDLNEKAVNDIRTLLGYENLYLGDATNPKLVLSGAPYDAIHAGDIIEHVSNLQGFFTFLYNNLGEGGKVVISTPNPCSKNAIKTWTEQGIIANMEHTTWITPTNLNELCRRHRFIFLESHYKMNKRKTLKNRILASRIRKEKDIRFSEFVYVIQKQ